MEIETKSLHQAAISRILTRALELFRNGEGWTKGEYARDANGNGTSPTTADYYPSPVCFCSVGAIERAMHELYPDATIEGESSRSLNSPWNVVRLRSIFTVKQAACTRKSEVNKDFNGSLIEFNDHPETTFEDIRLAFTDAVAGLSEGN